MGRFKAAKFAMGLVVFAMMGVACGADVTVNTGGSEASDEEASPSPTATAAPDPTVVPSPTPEPSPPPTTEPTVEELPQADDAAAGRAADVLYEESDLPSEFYDCVATELVGVPDLLAAIVDPAYDDFDALPAALQAEVIDLGVGCMDAGTFAGAVVGGFEVPLPPTATACFADQFASEDSRRALVQLGLLDNPADLDPAILDVAVGAIAVCVPSEVWITTLLDATDTDDFGDALNNQCVTDVFSDPEFLKALVLVSISDSSAQPDLSSEQFAAMAPFFDCIDIGALIVAEAEADGVILSAESAACISTSIREGGLFEAFFTGDELSGDELATLILGCLTAEELAQLAAS